MTENNLKKSTNSDIRLEIKQLRNRMDADYAKKLSAIITDRVLSSGIIDGKMDILIYKSFRNEVHTNELIRRLYEMGKKLAFPVTNGENIVAAIPECDTFSSDRFGIEIPEKYTVMKNPDLVFVPLIACDPAKNRLGFGKGYFDRYLSTVTAYKVGLCYDFQVVEHINPEKWDIPLDLIITENRII